MIHHDKQTSALRVSLPGCVLKWCSEWREREKKPALQTDLDRDLDRDLGEAVQTRPAECVCAAHHLFFFFFSLEEGGGGVTGEADQTPDPDQQ